LDNDNVDTETRHFPTKLLFLLEKEKVRSVPIFTIAQSQ
jgi:hypothetical protein